MTIKAAEESVKMTNKGLPRPADELLEMLFEALEDNAVDEAVDVARELGPHIEDIERRLCHTGGGRIEMELAVVRGRRHRKAYPPSEALRMAVAMRMDGPSTALVIEATLKALDAKGDFKTAEELLEAVTARPGLGVTQEEPQELPRAIRTWRLATAAPAAFERFATALETLAERSNAVITGIRRDEPGGGSGKRRVSTEGTG